LPSTADKHPWGKVGESTQIPIVAGTLLENATFTVQELTYIVTDPIEMR
jgi:hypothetical protein